MSERQLLVAVGGCGWDGPGPRCWLRAAAFQGTVNTQRPAPPNPLQVTDKRIVVTNNSPVFKRQTQVAFSKIKEVRAVPRAFGAWGDMVIFLKDGSRFELVGVDKFADIKRHIESCIIDG